MKKKESESGNESLFRNIENRNFQLAGSGFAHVVAVTMAAGQMIYWARYVFKCIQILQNSQTAAEFNIFS